MGAKRKRAAEGESKTHWSVGGALQGESRVSVLLASLIESISVDPQLHLRGVLRHSSLSSLFMTGRCLRWDYNLVKEVQEPAGLARDLRTELLL